MLELLPKPPNPIDSRYRSVSRFESPSGGEESSGASRKLERGTENRVPRRESEEERSRRELERGTKERIRSEREEEERKSFQKQKNNRSFTVYGRESKNRNLHEELKTRHRKEQGAQWQTHIPTSNDQAPKCSYLLPERFMYKNRLQEYTQKLHKALPKYETHRGGVLHGLIFHSSVEVDGVIYESPNVYPTKKDSEQDAARVALEAIEQKRKDEGCPLTPKDLMLCKLMLNEYAAKTNKAIPIYRSRQLDGPYILYVSSVEFDGVTFTGEAGNSKQASEQLAARDVIISLSGNPDSGPVISEIINSKRVNTAIPKTENLDQVCHRPMPPARWEQGREDNAAIHETMLSANDTLPVAAWGGPSLPPFHNAVGPETKGPHRHNSQIPVLPLAGKRGADPPGSSSGQVKKVRVNPPRAAAAAAAATTNRVNKTTTPADKPKRNQNNKPKRNTWVAFN